MSALLDLLRQQQAEAIAAVKPEPIVSGPTLEQLASRRLAMATSYPRGAAILAWCQTHTVEVGPHQDLVENLRRAMACQEFIGPHMLALYGAVPATCRVEPVKAGG